MRIAWIFGALAMAATATAADVRLRESAHCAAAVVRLGDVAEIQADDPALAAALAEIPLCPSPSAGDEQMLTQHEVRQLLSLSGVARPDVQVTGSERVVIARGSALSSGSSVRGAAVSGVRQALFDRNVAKKIAPAAKSAPIRPEAPAAQVKLVERGSAVRVYARKGGAIVWDEGKALSAGAAGETIPIELQSGKEKKAAKVVALQTVEVEVP